MAAQIVDIGDLGGDNGHADGGIDVELERIHGVGEGAGLVRHDGGVELGDVVQGLVIGDDAQNMYIGVGRQFTHGGIVVRRPDQDDVPVGMGLGQACDQVETHTVAQVANISDDGAVERPIEFGPNPELVAREGLGAVGNDVDAIGIVQHRFADGLAIGDDGIGRAEDRGIVGTQPVAERLADRPGQLVVDDVGDDDRKGQARQDIGQVELGGTNNRDQIAGDAGLGEAGQDEIAVSTQFRQGPAKPGGAVAVVMDKNAPDNARFVLDIEKALHGIAGDERPLVGLVLNIGGLLQLGDADRGVEVNDRSDTV